MQACVVLREQPVKAALNRGARSAYAKAKCQRMASIATVVSSSAMQGAEVMDREATSWSA